jgi:hypothetical protein
MEHTTYEIISRKDALSQALKHYFTGKPCKRGHVDQRYVSTNQCCSCIKKQSKAWQENNREKSRECSAKWQKKMRSTEEGRQRLETINAPSRAKYNKTAKRKEARRREFEARESNPVRRVESRIRCLLRNVIIANGGRKAAKTEELLGCTVAEARAHLEAQFLPGMTWDNHGEWHIDHIRPCASFDFSDSQQQKECSHYTNLQPLWAKDNLSKSDKWQAAV